jgi:nucleoid-associated protein YgaU
MSVVIAALLAGCGNDEKAALQDQNLILSDRVAELEYQLQQQQAQNASSQQFTPSQPLQPALENTSVYLVVQGDTLWSIAKKQLGSGARYKEILALNPTVSANKSLAIGTKLTLPPK